MPRIKPTTSFVKRTKPTTNYVNSREGGRDYYTWEERTETWDDATYAWANAYNFSPLSTSFTSNRYDNYVLDLAGSILQDLNGNNVSGLSGYLENKITTNYEISREKGKDYYTWEDRVETWEEAIYTWESAFDTSSLSTSYISNRYDMYVKDITGSILMDLEGDEVLGITGSLENIKTTNWI